MQFSAQSFLHIQAIRRRIPNCAVIFIAKYTAARKKLFFQDVGYFILFSFIH